ncbi:MAG: hypothetical protein BGO69_05455 [Bacteroidetes bacterium 46-16]|nr:MAG: hypothetical protein BGO69_05455 [Bacteroidetes bacterium 46-16]
MTSTKIAVIVLAAIMFSACSNQNCGEVPDYTGFIPKDTANIMISSYLTSIASDSTPKPAPNLNSLIIDAKELRTYLNNNRNIAHVKLMLAHTLKYINEGNAGKYAGYRSDALTIVVAGYDSAGNYIFAPGNTVPDHCGPCPDFCPVSGTAANNLLQ